MRGGSPGNAGKEYRSNTNKNGREVSFGRRKGGKKSQTKKPSTFPGYGTPEGEGKARKTEGRSRGLTFNRRRLS